VFASDSEVFASVVELKDDSAVVIHLPDGFDLPPTEKLHKYSFKVTLNATGMSVESTALYFFVATNDASHDDIQQAVQALVDEGRVFNITPLGNNGQK
jgi:hypothetical protein